MEVIDDVTLQLATLVGGALWLLRGYLPARIRPSA
jgi:hypothetical protein